MQPLFHVMPMKRCKTSVEFTHNHTAIGRGGARYRMQWNNNQSHKPVYSLSVVNLQAGPLLIMAGNEKSHTKWSRLYTEKNVLASEIIIPCILEHRGNTRHFQKKNLILIIQNTALLLFTRTGYHPQFKANHRKSIVISAYIHMDNIRKSVINKLINFDICTDKAWNNFRIK